MAVNRVGTVLTDLTTILQTGKRRQEAREVVDRDRVHEITKADLQVIAVRTPANKAKFVFVDDFKLVHDDDQIEKVRIGEQEKAGDDPSQDRQ